MELANLFTDLKFTKWLIFFSKFTKWIMDNDSSERALRLVKLDLDIALRVIKMAHYLRDC